MWGMIPSPFVSSEVETHARGVTTSLGANGNRGKR
jgi:hypothetical protein